MAMDRIERWGTVSTTTFFFSWGYVVMGFMTNKMIGVSENWIVYPISKALS